MEFIKANFLNTTTQISVNNNTSTVSNLFNRNKAYQYYTDGLNNDLTTCSITITFSATTAVSRIALLDTNIKGLTIFYNGSTANTFSLSNADTTSSNYTGNTDANKYFRFSTVQCSSITIDAKATFIADSEKYLGLLLLSDHIHTLELMPSAKNFKTKKIAKQVVHKLSDGGARVHNISNKWDFNLKLEYISETERDSLFEIYDGGYEFNFCPFGTATSWDAQIAECVWDGNFEFFEYSDNAASSGFSGQISLMETPT
jgi:hypothetical protein